MGHPLLGDSLPLLLSSVTDKELFWGPEALSSFYVFLLSIFTRITSELIIYDKRTLLDIGHRYTNLLQDTLSTNPTWPLEFLQNNPRRRKKHCGKRAGIRNRLRERAHSPPLLSILLANVQSLENKMDDLRARISFQWDIKDCNILCLTETWLTPWSWTTL